MCQTIDVICQHCRDGSIIPLKIRVSDDEQEYHTYVIKSYKERSSNQVLLPNEAFVTSNIRRFECNIEVFGITKRVILHYNKSESTWDIFY